MNKKTGLYISTEGKNIYRTVYSMRGETIMSPTTVEEDSHEQNSKKPY